MSANALDDTKLRILEAAGRTFAERGFREATVRDICQAAGSNIASINYHFGDKERLYIESVKLAHREMLQSMPLPSGPRAYPPPPSCTASSTRFFAACSIATTTGSAA